MTAPRDPTARAAPKFAAEGALADLSPNAERMLLERGGATNRDVQQRVAGIIEDVRRDGDAALIRFALTFDGVALDRLEVPRNAWTARAASHHSRSRAHTATSSNS